MIGPGPSDDAVFEALRRQAAARGEALRAAEHARRLADTDETEAEPASPPEPKHATVWDETAAKRVAIVARQVGLPPTASRAQVLDAIERLSRADIRSELRRRLG